MTFLMTYWWLWIILTAVGTATLIASAAYESYFMVFIGWAIAGLSSIALTISVIAHLISFAVKLLN